jgi:hypothetical protein
LSPAGNSTLVDGIRPQSRCDLSLRLRLPARRLLSLSASYGVEMLDKSSDPRVVPIAGTPVASALLRVQSTKLFGRAA